MTTYDEFANTRLHALLRYAVMLTGARTWRRTWFRTRWSRSS